MRKKIVYAVGWAVTVLAQAVAGGVVVFLLLSVWSIEKVSTLGQFLLIVFSIWLGFVIGVYGAGMAALSLRRAADLRVRARFISAAGVAFIPFLALLAIGASVGPGNQPAFQNVVMDTWQPLLAQLGLLSAIVGFYIPGWINR
jgi:hypothetical protein